MNDERKIRVIPATNSRRLFVDDDSPIKMQKKKVENIEPDILA